MAGDGKFRDAIRKELKGKDLVCWCAPKSCHADILLEIANARELGSILPEDGGSDSESQ